MIDKLAKLLMDPQTGGASWATEPEDVRAHFRKLAKELLDKEGLAFVDKATLDHAKKSIERSEQALMLGDAYGWTEWAMEHEKAVKKLLEES